MVGMTEYLLQLARMITESTPDALKEKKTGVLSLGTRRDAITWEKGCQAVNIDILYS